MDGRDRRMNGHTDVQPETIIPRYYRVARYKNKQQQQQNNSNNKDPRPAPAKKKKKKKKKGTNICTIEADIPEQNV